MSDARLRELERLWKETGSVEDEATYLVERARLGDLARDRLELAAYLGHEAARIAVPSAGTPARLSDWVRGLEVWGKAACVRAAVAAAQLALPVWEAQRVSPGLRPREAPRKALEAVLCWIREPSTERVTSVSTAAVTLAWPGQPSSLKVALWTALTVAPVPGAPRETPGVWASRAAEEASSVEGLSEDQVRAAIRDALVPWALGREKALEAGT